MICEWFMFLQNARALKYDYEQTIDGIGASKKSIEIACNFNSRTIIL